ncbi:Piso0_005582 [Millerozyma farinosa CBS 7064]|uniref:Piso0_005582 protein n=1 Tax=Pichia sorbitophila (strain ATCC MYA-4447 / BCRC 22081 / CBS 7064 / NBRC 10061 / NRRL Y-12695) TaxID=559304 RepID=G8XZD6_PICSO|nr:Piso0_005582 [Millerozyma farinosa CBS 7064]
MVPQQRKRNRIPTSCSVCRKRKSRCDKVRPVCGTCRKKSIVHLCYYESDKVNKNGSPVNGPLIPDGVSPMPVNVNNYSNVYAATPAGANQSFAAEFKGTHGTSAEPYVYNGVIREPKENDTAPEVPVNANRPILGTGPPIRQPQHGSPPVPFPQFQQLPAQNFNANAAPAQQSPFYAYQPPYVSPQVPAIPAQQMPRQSPIMISPGALAPEREMSQRAPPSLPQQIPSMPHGDVNAMNSYVSSESDPSSFHGVSRYDSEGTQKNPAPTYQTKPSTLPPARYSDATGGSQGSTDGLVSIPLGPHSVLKLNPADVIDSFSSASLSLLVDGPYWQQQGSLSFIGLLKSDRFLKFLRQHATSIFKTGEMSHFIKRKVSKKSKGGSSNVGVGQEHNASHSLSEEQRNSESIHGDAEPKEKDGVDAHKKTNNDREEPYDSNELDSDEDEEDEEEDDEEGFVSDDDVILTKIRASKNAAGRPDRKMKKIKVPYTFFPGFKSFGSSRGLRTDYYEVVIKSALAVLPKKRTIKLLSERFFKYVCPFVPVIDDVLYRLDLEHLLLNENQSDTGEYCTKIRINNLSDLTSTGITLLVILLGYMSLYHNNEIYNGINDTEKEIMNDMNRCSLKEYIYVVEMCIPDELMTRKSSFKIIQLLSLCHFYRQVAPEDSNGLGGTDSQILFGTIIRHAYSIGLNRDPKKYYSDEHVTRKERLVWTWRKLWHYIIKTDANEAITAGMALMVPELETSDVQLPLREESSENVKKTCFFMTEVHASYRKLCKILTNLQSKPKIVDILTSASELESQFVNFFGEDFFKSYICKPPHTNEDLPKDSEQHEESYLKVIKFILFIQLRTHLSCIYHKIAIFYEGSNAGADEGRGGQTETALFKFYFKSVIEMLYIISYCLDSSVKLFGRNYDYILTAVAERCMIKIHMFLASFFIRILHHQKVLSIKVSEGCESKAHNSEKLDAIEKLLGTVLSEADLFVGNFDKLSSKYINSYRVNVMSYFILKKIMEDPDVFLDQTLSEDKSYREGTNALDYFSAKEVEQLQKLCDEYAYPAQNDGTHLEVKNENGSEEQGFSPLSGLNLVNIMKKIGSKIEATSHYTQNRSNDVLDSSVLDVFNWMPDPDSLTIQNKDLLSLFELYANPDQSA